MNNFVETVQLTFECFHGHSPRNNGLVKFRDVKFDDASILFNFCGILSNKRCIVYINNMTRYDPFSARFNGVWLYIPDLLQLLLAFNTVLFYAPKSLQGSNSLSCVFSEPTVNRKKKEENCSRSAIFYVVSKWLLPLWSGCYILPVF